jgi:hypothetical protein
MPAIHNWASSSDLTCSLFDPRGRLVLGSTRVVGEVDLVGGAELLLRRDGVAGQLCRPPPMGVRVLDLRPVGSGATQRDDEPGYGRTTAVLGRGMIRNTL